MAKADRTTTQKCPNCYSDKTYNVRPGVWRCVSCSATWERR